MKGPKKEYFMKLNYKITIDNPSTHQVLVEISAKREASESELNFFLPRWSPGSYLIREYSRHLSKIKAQNSKGVDLSFVQTDISTFKLDFNKSGLKTDDLEFKISYYVFCHELTVRTSHVDVTHAYLHLPTLLMGILDHEMITPVLEVKFPPIWNRLVTGLKDISSKREVFLYQAKNYDELIDSPIEIGCLETDGFKAFDVDHDVCYYGELLPHKENMTKDIKTIVQHIGGFFGGVPYEKYSFITHFVPGLYGGLEHLNSTALQYCPTQITTRKGYVNYLCLVSHEYFHLWNVKRIRPLELGPFDYLKEATTHLLWLAEGLTSLMDELFVYRTGLITLDEYLDMQKDNLNRYLATPGRKFHSLNDSSFNAWIKLYRPDENLNNSSISYYLKGGIVFWALNFLMVEKGKSINDFLLKLWSLYKDDPKKGVTEEEVYKIIEDIAGSDVRSKFEVMTSTTEEIDIDSIVKKVGLKIEWDHSESPWLGIDTEHNGDRVIAKAVTLDGPAYKGGINAGDEILAINKMRVLKDRFSDYPKFLRVNETYEFTISRLSQIMTVNVNVGVAPSKIKNLVIADKVKIEGALNP
jgi:predicted metalloprotease with PDZ domain